MVKRMNVCFVSAFGKADGGKGFILSILSFFIFSLALSGCEREEGPTGIVFNHEQHLGRGYTCGLCHQFVHETDPLRPPERVCAFCHEIGSHDDPDMKCGLCHSRKDLKADSLPRPEFSDSRFQHEPHLDSGVDCEECHHNQSQADRYGDIRFGRMKQCMSCHRARRVSVKCSTCHEFWREDIEPESHDAYWIELHGGFAKKQFESNCGYCHSNKQFCQECHMAEPPRSHTLFFRNRGHGSFVKNDRMQCEPCHQQDFCLACHHRDSGVKPSSHIGGFGGRRPYLHCASCHFPDGRANGCNTCHPVDRIRIAHLDPEVTQVPEFVVNSSLFPGCLDACHPFQQTPPMHPLSTMKNEDCLFCHLK